MKHRRTQAYHNPILPGFYPDPSVIRADQDYYMVTSTFEYMPGVPIFHSRDLIHWDQIGHVLTRESQVNLRSRKSSEGIFAPVLRYHDGVFYMITTDVQGIGNFYVTAKDPAGLWSDPITIPYGNIDPSLFFDEDGKVYVSTQAGFGETSHVIQYEIDAATGKALSEPVIIWKGDEGPWVEGPHLYKINGWYYMMTASGGTGPQHREIIGRSKQPYGPFDRLPYPILTHNQLPEHPIQCLGHAELVEDTDGHWWAFFLGVRPVNNGRSVLGRETFLAPVHWTEEGWPMIDGNDGSVQLVMHAAEPYGSPLVEYRTDFACVDNVETHGDVSGPGLGMEWIYPRFIPNQEAVSLSERPGTLRLQGTADTLSDGGSTVLVCRRQQHHQMRAEVRMEYAPVLEGEEAGLTVRLSDQTHYRIGLTAYAGSYRVQVITTKQGKSEEIAKADGPSSSLWLAISSNAEQYIFEYSRDGVEWVELGCASTYDLSPESEGAFIGVCIGMYAWGSKRSERPSTPAYFQAFSYMGSC